MRASRALSAVWLVIYALLVVAVPALDARAEARGSEAYAHIEATTDACPPAHDHDSCALCRTLRSAAAPEARVSVGVVAGTASRPLCAMSDATGDPAHSLPRSRAPPTR